MPQLKSQTAKPAGWVLVIATALVAISPASASADTLQGNVRAGDVYEITQLGTTEGSSSGGSRSSSRSGNAMAERIIGLRNDGAVEAEYNLPEGSTDDDRAREWRFPARILSTQGAAPELLNESELSARLAQWLTNASIPEAACGQWIFTWTAIKIECDPLSIVPIISHLDLRRVPLADGSPYTEPGALGSTTLRRTETRTTGSTFEATLLIDPEALRLARAESDVVVGQIMREPRTLEDALAARAGEQISGTVTITFETDADGQVTQRTRVTQTQIVEADGTVENQTSTEIVERRLLRRAE